MKIEGLLTDEAILAELAGRFVQRRLELQLTQEMLAEQAGVSKRTVERVEAGATTQMSTISGFCGYWTYWIGWNHWCPRQDCVRWIYSS